MLSAIAAILLGFAFLLVRSVHRNRRALAAGEVGYQPRDGLIRWNDPDREDAGDEG